MAKLCFRSKDLSELTLPLSCNKGLGKMHGPPEWSMEVPENLKKCIICDIWKEEVVHKRLGCAFQVDEEGFFVHILNPLSGGEVIEICQISDVRPGVIRESKCYSHMNSHYLSDLDWQKKAFTICSGSDLVNVVFHHLVCQDAKTAKDWREALLSITHNNRFNNVSVWTNLRKHWKRLHLLCDNNGKISAKVIAGTFASGRATEKDVKEVMEELHLVRPDDTSASVEPSAFTFFAFYKMYRALCPREDIDELFTAIAGESCSTIDGKKFAEFLNEHQRDPRLNEILYPKIKAKDAEKIILKYELDDEARAKKRMTIDGLIRYLMSDDTSPINLEHLEMYMNMDQPLAHYYINSSHNTYLVGRQCFAKSSVEMYRQVLLAGCRCIELDCYDGEDGEPIITHGKALCTVISFKDVINAIRDTAFVTSEYPVILSFENHCSKSQQLVMAKYCEEIFQEKLLKEPLPGYPLEPGRVLPSPTALKGKILIKNKRLPPEKEKLEYEKYKRHELRKRKANQLENAEDEEEDEEEEEEQISLRDEGEEYGNSDVRPKKEETQEIKDPDGFTQKSRPGDVQIKEKYKQSGCEEPSDHTVVKSNGTLNGELMGDASPANRTDVSVSATEACTEEAGIPESRSAFEQSSENLEDPCETPSEASADTTSLAKCDSQQSFSTVDIAKAIQYRNSLEFGAVCADVSEFLQLSGLADGYEKKLRSLQAGDPQSPSHPARQNLIALHKKDSRTSQGSFTSSPNESSFNDRGDSKYGSDPRRDANEVPLPPEIPHTSSTTNVHPYLSMMVNYAQPIKFQSFEDSESKNIHHNMSSFSEVVGHSKVIENPIEFVNYNKRQMSRIYPKGRRYDSTNFMPHIYWGAGCQMVALNFQTPDEAMQLNQGKFEYNGNCGYLLKPAHMRSDRDFNPLANTSVDGVIAAQCTVRVLSGQFLSETKVRTSVEVSLFGLPGDTVWKKFRTTLGSENGLNPKYDDEPFCFRKVVLPDLALLRFGVYDDGNHLLWQRVIPLNSLQPGYRHITLRTEGNFSTTLPSLFCYIQFADYVPSIHQDFVDQLDCITNKSKAVRSTEPRRQDSEQDWRDELITDEARLPTAVDDARRDERKSAEPSIQMSEREGSTSKKGSKSEMEVKEINKFPDITVCVLIKDNKRFMKLVRKQEKRMRRLRAKHIKQLDDVMRSQCIATAKLQSPKRKLKKMPDAGFPEFWEKQVNQWSDLKEKQRSEEVLKRENHVKARFEELEKMMRAAQARQMKELEAIHNRDRKDMNAKQAKMSVKTIEEVRNDVSLKSTFDRDSCIKEKKEQMTKIFAEERRQFSNKQQREKQKLAQTHKDQLDRFEKERAQALEKISNERKENDFVPIREFCA